MFLFFPYHILKYINIHILKLSYYHVEFSPYFFLSYHFQFLNFGYFCTLHPLAMTDTDTF